MTEAAAGCCDCADSPADTWLGEHGPLCDRCFDARIAAHTGMPRLPEPPKPLMLTGPDGRTHRMRYRMHRGPAGIGVGLHEDTAGDAEGFAFEVLGDHDADLDQLVRAVAAEASAEIGRCYLEPDQRGGWQVADDQIAGRLEHDPDTGPAGPHQVIVDGRALSWEQLGVALGSFEGWRFRLTLDDRCSEPPRTIMTHDLLLEGGEREWGDKARYHPLRCRGPSLVLQP